jgi:hypothetical protein
MGLAPVLIMLAAMGIEYGWQPDGTTSERGDNVEYIVQISPDHADRLANIGDISSTIDPSIQGRVSRIVVRIGNGPLPKNAGRAIKTPPATSTARATDIGSSDESAIPIPEINDSVALNASGASIGQTPSGSSASVMKPDPQGSSFQMPESLQTGAASALDQVRSRAAEAASQLDAQTRSTLEAQQNSLVQGTTDAINRTTTQLQNGFNNAINPSANPSANVSPGTARSNGVSTDPVTNRDNRWSDLTNPARTTSGVATSGGPSTDPVDPAVRSTPWPATVGATQPSDPRSLSTPSPASNPPSTFANPASVNPSFSAAPAASPASTFSPPPTAFSGTNTGLNAGTSTPARDPSDPKWSGYGTSPNFGALPGSASSRGVNDVTASPTGLQTTATSSPSVTTSDPRFTQSASGLIQDAQGNYFDSLGRQVDRNGQPINPATARHVNSAGQPTDQFGNLLDANGQAYDQYGRPVDAFNRVISDSRVAQTNLNPPSNFPQSTAPSLASPQAPLTTQQVFTAEQIAQQQLVQQQLAATQSQLRAYQQREAQQRETDLARTRLVTFEDESSSPSDARFSSTIRTSSSEQVSNPAPVVPTRPRNVAVQFFFNFVLLISLVGNAYLIFETNNLRRKFRNMISSVRTSKVSAQPVA